MMIEGNSIADRVVRWCFRHWLGIANTLVLLYGGLPWLSPLLLAWGYPEAGQALFWLYGFVCHQNPDSSYWLLGYQVAFCHREAAMYTSLFVGGLCYALLRHRLRPISLRATGLLLLPMLLDGSTQMLNGLFPWVGLRSATHDIGSFNWWMRTITGVLFAVAVVAGIYPRLERDLAGIGHGAGASGRQEAEAG